jgi:hypothetical protein
MTRSSTFFVCHQFQQCMFKIEASIECGASLPVPVAWLGRQPAFDCSQLGGDLKNSPGELK